MKRLFFQWALVLVAGLLAGCASHEPKFDESAQVGVPPPPPEPMEFDHYAKTPYVFPLISVGAKFSNLPPAVQNTIRAEVGTLPLTDVVKDTSSGATVYKIFFANERLFPPLFIAPDGSVLNPDLTVAVPAPEEHLALTHGGIESLKTSDLPSPVMRTIQERAPTGEIAFIEKETWGSRDIYIVSFKDPTHNPRLFISADGSLAGGSRH